MNEREPIFKRWEQGEPPVRWWSPTTRCRIVAARLQSCAVGIRSKSMTEASPFLDSCKVETTVRITRVHQSGMKRAHQAKPHRYSSRVGWQELKSLIRTFRQILQAGYRAAFAKTKSMPPPKPMPESEDDPIRLGLEPSSECLILCCCALESARKRMPDQAR